MTVTQTAAPTVTAELQRGYPAAARFLAEWQTIGPRLSRLAGAVSASVRDYASVRKMPIALPVWVLLAAGLATAVVAVAALVPRAHDAR